MTAIDDVLAANRDFARAFDKGDLPAPPKRRLAVVTCMDARLHPETFLGLNPGDAHVIRNAGGRVTDDVLRSLIISSHLLGTNEYMVIHHTDCGMRSFTNEDLQRRLLHDCGVDASGIDFMPFSDLDQSVRDDVQRIAESPFIPAGITVRGFIYDVRTGGLSEIHRNEGAGER